LEQGQAIADCEYCWRDERQGMSSFRQLNHGVNDNILELYVNNTCNHMCSYCSPKFSSEWQHSIQTQGMLTNISATNQRNLTMIPSDNSASWITDMQDYILNQPDDSVVLKLLGGEPLMQVRNLESLLSMDSVKIKKIILVTNLSPPNNKFLLWLLDHVPATKLHINISLDASPSYNHVPRSGFNAHSFHNNLDLLRSYRISHFVLSVVSVLSVFDLPQFVAWLDQQHLPNQFNRLYNPDCLDPILLPRWIRQTIWDQMPEDYQNTVIREVLDSEQSPVDIKRFEQYSYLSQYFDRTRQDPLLINNELFQEYWTWLERTYRK
jgi:sulfatase maturation enzyme AslB (radical SAM superfamily)